MKITMEIEDCIRGINLILFSRQYLSAKPYRFRQQRLQRTRTGESSMTASVKHVESWTYWTRHQRRKRANNRKSTLRYADGLFVIWNTQNCQGSVVFRGHNVKDDTSGCAVFTKQDASASHMTAAKILDSIPTLPGMSGEAYDAVSAKTQVEHEWCLQITSASEDRNAQQCGSSRIRNCCPKRWDNIDGPMVPLERNQKKKKPSTGQTAMGEKNGRQSFTRTLWGSTQLGVSLIFIDKLGFSCQKTCRRQKNMAGREASEHQMFLFDFTSRIPHFQTGSFRAKITTAGTEFKSQTKEMDKDGAYHGATTCRAMQKIAWQVHVNWHSVEQLF